MYKDMIIIFLIVSILILSIYSLLQKKCKREKFDADNSYQRVEYVFDGTKPTMLGTLKDDTVLLRELFTISSPTKVSMIKVNEQPPSGPNQGWIQWRLETDNYRNNEILKKYTIWYDRNGQYYYLYFDFSLPSDNPDNIWQNQDYNPGFHSQKVKDFDVTKNSSGNIVLQLQNSDFTLSFDSNLKVKEGSSPFFCILGGCV